MNEKKVFKSVEDNGKEVEYEIITTLSLEQTKKDYIVYTDNTFDRDGNLNVYAAVFYPSEPTRKLELVETENEWNQINKVLEGLNN